MNRVAIALGSNVGDREAHLAFAVQRLKTVLTGVRASRWHDTVPVGVEAQANFLNGAVTGTTSLPAPDLLQTLLAIEWVRGRQRPHLGAPRTLDLDLILYGDAIMDEPGLRIPHPRYRDRLFVLEPLAEIAGDWVDPEVNVTVEQLLKRHRRG